MSFSEESGASILSWAWIQGIQLIYESESSEDEEEFDERIYEYFLKTINEI